MLPETIKTVPISAWKYLGFWVIRPREKLQALKGPPYIPPSVPGSSSYKTGPVQAGAVEMN